jgi:hypothetical protein
MWVYVFYWHLVHFTAICNILWTFGIVRIDLVYFSRFGILYREKSGNPDPKTQLGLRIERMTPDRSSWMLPPPPPIAVLPFSAKCLFEPENELWWEGEPRNFAFLTFFWDGCFALPCTGSWIHNLESTCVGRWLFWLGSFLRQKRSHVDSSDDISSLAGLPKLTNLLT